MTGSCSPVDGIARVSIGPAGAARAGVAVAAGAVSLLHATRGERTMPVAASEATVRNPRRDVMAIPPAGTGPPWEAWRAGAEACVRVGSASHKQGVQRHRSGRVAFLGGGNEENEHLARPRRCGGGGRDAGQVVGLATGGPGARTSGPARKLG